MTSGTRLKFMIIDEEECPQPPCWRHPFSRFGCDRLRRILNRFPHKADAIARATTEGGSRLRAGKVAGHG